MERVRATARHSRFGSICDLPGYIIIDILARLPLKAILNCRYVCKSWRNTISDTYFAKVYLSKHGLPAMLMLRPGAQNNFYLVEPVGAYSFYGGHNDDACAPNIVVLKFNPSFDTSYLEKDLFVLAGSGFGFSPKTNQFKVLRFSLPRRLSSFKLETEINTLGTNLWRKVDNPPDYLQWLSRGCFLNGGLHWIVHDSNNRFKSLCVFDFGDEQFRPVPSPSHFVANHEGTVDQMNMALLGGCLAIYQYSSDYQLDIWLMKDYGGKESWTKEFVIETPTKSFLYQPLALLDNGEIFLLLNLNSLVSYSKVCQIFSSVEIDGCRRDLKAKPFTPSFVSIRDVLKG
ncbi:hypothetical protein F0562_008223 [Nyssa sinensis]|uniref:F-box domain-containing protein n=1 Tax=Nyssa sinensis TaxID=561372 RepID=A0A5J5A8M9_9ASTE|nr:hypothetical protein F0562_008223 [Nyssa sinensis]